MKCTSPLCCSTEACPGKPQPCPGMECATGFDGFIYHQQPHVVNVPSWQLLLVSCANHPRMYVAGSIYGQWQCHTVFYRCHPGPQLLHINFFLQISHFEFHHLYRPLGISSPQSFPCREPMYGLWCIFSITRKKICKGLSHYLDWLLSRGSQVLTVYGKPQYSVLLKWVKYHLLSVFSRVQLWYGRYSNPASKET